MIKTFVQVGDRVTVYQDPYTMEDKEGDALVVNVRPQSDMESAYVDVEFDNERGEENYPRWVLPAHVKAKKAAPR